ncbi:hypothetical protein HC251_07760 [Iamia sp. SCSIO 61187]|uniref:hypothetical protein n=1 Tax=Iamia sp. SCSIO 61187 TaxID=2722752 RepID=UPI001C633267|nr:hypothetical protein [Iamia sp. SCSIO 61187]QYG92345.1 hypothetical protein HC251_07760 [Iamia sp. SCSIO 61187]
MTKKLLLLTTLVVGVLAFFAGPASAQYPDAPTAVIDSTSVLAGGVVNITGDNCFDTDSVPVLLEGEQIGSLPVADDGTFGGAVTIPSDTDPGTYTLEAICGETVLSIEITVSAAGVTPGPGGPGAMGPGSTGDDALARTGTGIDGLLKVGGGLLVAGAAATLLATKRRTATA